MKTFQDINFKNKKVLVRCDFNVLLDEDRNILSDFRIRQAIPAIKYLIKQKSKIILISHLGRPKNRENKYSLKVIVSRLERLLDKRIVFLEDCIGENTIKEVEKLKSGEIILLENLRFHKEEEGNDKNFAKELSKLADIYINNAFSVSHRTHASVVGVPQYLPSGAGLLLEKEIEVLTNIIKNPKTPLVAIFGGKDGDFGAINRISEKADFVLVSWLIEKQIIEKNIKLKYPEKIIKTLNGPKGSLDISEETILLFKDKIKEAKTIFWSGPLGKIENEKYSKGTETIARAIIESQAFSVIGGGDTISFVNKLQIGDKFNFLSTGGNAMLEFLSGKKLPGLEILE